MRYLTSLLYTFTCLGPVLYSPQVKNDFHQFDFFRASSQQSLTINQQTQTQLSDSSSDQILKKYASYGNNKDELSDQVRTQNSAPIPHLQEKEIYTFEDKLLDQLEVVALKISYSTKLYDTIKKNYLGDSKILHIGHSTSENNEKIIHTLHAFRYDGDQNRMLKETCPFYEQKKDELLVVCSKNLSFKKIFYSQETFLAVVPNKNHCPLPHANEIRRELWPLSDQLKPEQKLAPIYMISTSIKQVGLNQYKIEDFNHEQLHFVFEGKQELCFPSSPELTSLQFESGLNYESCSKDESCLSGCCKNNMCTPNTDNEDTKCAKEVGQSCLDHSYCVFEKNYPVFSLSRHKKTGVCTMKNTHNGAYSRCIANRCVPLYEHLTTAMISSPEKLKTCEHDADPDFIDITPTPGAETIRYKYEP